MVITPASRKQLFKIFSRNTDNNSLVLVIVSCVKEKETEKKGRVKDITNKETLEELSAITPGMGCVRPDGKHITEIFSLISPPQNPL